METLGLGSSRQKEDNIFQRLFWPTIHNQYDVDLLGQQGFWLAASIGVVSGIMAVVSGQALVGLVVAFVFIAGACGVRQRSIPASILIFVLYLLNSVSSYVLMPGRSGNPIVVAVALMLLLANIRATVISETWLSKSPEHGDHDLPERSTTTLSDRVANDYPAAVWPKIKWVFFIVAVVLIFLTAIGAIFGHRIQRSAKTSPSSSETFEIPVAPAR